MRLPRHDVVEVRCLHRIHALVPPIAVHAAKELDGLMNSLGRQAAETATGGYPEDAYSR
jgi:hypothetical protein